MENVDYATLLPGTLVQVYDNLNGHMAPQYTQRFVKVTPCYVILAHNNGTGVQRYHRANGLVVGYSWPHYTTYIA